ncbi:glycosyl hydrolase family 47 [Diaporthe helianthi]|uniref:alpha-1,2-Mannosidase n=1 Tax=Diaporthe helianthi TaxID=158607 RepID=A0A2P5HEH2_DIAHE|nr:glycosyl hydrolase family 47 [Diaporthe helianthi]
MWPRQINFQQQTANTDSQFTLGALADSLYEYLPKMYILTGGLAENYETMYRKAMDTVTRHILFRPMLPFQTDILFSGDVFVREDGYIDRNFETQHLGCFTGGMFLLGGQTFAIDAHVHTGEKLARGCAWAYDAFPTGLMPEITGFVACPTLEPCEWDEKRWAEEGDQELAKGFRHARDARYILRPEAIESIFYLFRITGREELRETAWKMFQSVVKATETGLAYSAIKDVRAKGETEKEDFMESFWTAETLKYFYLIFSPPDLISLDEWVLNTEAHPFRRPR